MPIKDQYGIWRQDKFKSAGRKPKRCPKCKGELEYDLEPDYDEYEDDIDRDWELDKMEDRKEAHRLERLLHSSPVYAECLGDECGFQKSYGPIQYYDPDSNSYKLTEPLTKAEAAKCELEALRLAQEEAGQIPLFSDQIT